MMNNSYGLSADVGRNGLLDFSVINTHIIFKGVYLGCTTANTELSKEMDSIDISYQQQGSKPQDKVITGMELKLKTSLAMARESVMALLDGVIHKDDRGDSYLPTELFTSIKESKGGALLLAKSNADGTISEKSDDHLWLYEAIPLVLGNVIVGGMEQQSKEVEFSIILKNLDGYNDYRGDIRAAFGYFGDSPRELPKVIWPAIPSISHDGHRIIVDYKGPIEQHGSLCYRISQYEKGLVVSHDACGVIDGYCLIITPHPLANNEEVVLNKVGGVALFGSEAQLLHANGALSAMLPEVMVPYQSVSEKEARDD